MSAPAEAISQTNPTNSEQDPNLKTGLKLDDLAPGITTSMVHLKEEDYSKTVHVKGSEHSGTRRLMICDEAQPGGGIALNYALNSLVTTHDHVFLVTVLPLAMVDFAFMGLLPEHDVALDLKKLETMNHNAMKTLEIQAQKFVEKGADVTIHVVHGKANYSLVALAKFHQIDIMIMGRRKMGMMQRFSSGSVSRFVLDHADQTVMVVKL